MTRICLISDTHNRTVKVPDCDILVHAGDWTRTGAAVEVSRFLDFVEDTEARGIPVVYIAGNHDVGVHCFRSELDKTGHYLCNSACEVKGVRFWGSPYTPAYGEGWDFQLSSTLASRACWAQMGYCDVLVTHGPPRGILDRNGQGIDCGDIELAARICEMPPRVHAFGHIHEARGMALRRKTMYINASVCTKDWNGVVREPFVLDLE